MIRILALLAFIVAPHVVMAETFSSSPITLDNITGGPLAVDIGGTGATSLGNSLTNADSTLNVTQCVGRTVSVTTDTIVAGDGGCPVTYTSSSNTAVGIAAATSTGLTAGFGVSVNNTGTGTVTVTPTTSTIGGNSSLAIPGGTGCYIYSDGTNYILDRSACTALPLSYSALPANFFLRTVGITVDGGGSALTTGLKGFYRVPFSGTITGYSLQSDITGSVVFDVWKANDSIPDNGDSITASVQPTLSSAQYVDSTTLTGWNIDVNAGDVIGFNIDSASTLTRVTLQLYITTD